MKMTITVLENISLTKIMLENTKNITYIKKTIMPFHVLTSGSGCEFSVLIFSQLIYPDFNYNFKMYMSTV